MLADSRRLGQVLVNLILNASKFGPQNSDIEISVTLKADAIRVTVADRGPGVSPEQAAAPV